MWDLSSQLPEARVTVGSGSEAGWNVQAPEVMPLHFEFYWDGKSLWVGPPLAGTLTVDGERVLSWRQLTGRARLEFGRAAMLVESSQSIEVAAIATAPLAVSVDGFVEGEATAISEEQPVAFGGLAAPTTAPLEPAATRVLDPEAGDGLPRPGFGGAAGPAAVGAIGHGTAGAPVDPPPELKTQILDTEALGIQPSAPAAPSPPSSPVLPGVGPGAGPVGDSRPTLLASDMSTDILSQAGSAPSPREVVGPGGAKFALPPIDGGAAAPASAGWAQLKEVPTRTWILLGVTLVVALGAIFLGVWRKEQQQQALAAEAASQQQTQAQQAQAHADLLRERIRADAERLQRERERFVALVEGDISEALEAARERVLEALPQDATEDQTEAAVREASREAIEKLAVDATVSNDLRRAFGFYLRLKRDYPRPEYDEIVEALRAKLECRRGVRRDGTPCPT